MSIQADRWILAAALATTLLSAPALAGWEYVGVGDCAGNDTGSSLGAQPDPARCSPGAAGTAVVCWDEVQYKNAKVHKPVCAYKRLQSSQCTGGPNPGLLYRCSTSAAHGATAAPPPPPQPGAAVAPPPPTAAPPPGPAAAGYLWKLLSVGDCVGNDTASTKGSVPSSDKCGPGTVGTTAVCWDGGQYKHPKLGQAACIYKRTFAQRCSGGTAPGQVYECAAVGASQPPPTSAPPPQGPPTTWTPPPADPGFAWSYQRIGDCTGGDTGSSRGPYPILDRCGQTTLGMTAVCWDGGAQKNKGFGHAGCTYKRFAAKGCKGGASPGYLYECTALAPGQPPPPYPEIQLAMPSHPPGNPPPPPAADGFVWRYTRVDDCEASEIGSSKGEAPSPELCNEATVGIAAVCWDDKHHKHHKKKHPACAYKRAAASTCTGGSSPGTMYECVRAAAAYNPPPQPAGYQPAYAWRYLRNDGCHGHDEGSTQGAVPAADRCDASNVGQVSVCWDGVSTRHPSGKVGCSYKSKSAAGCTGSQHPGALYECAASTVSAQPPPARPPPPAAFGFTWRYLRVDGCHGQDLGSTQGSMPAADRCEAATVGQVSVCWDGATTRHPSGKVACSYKSKSAAACTGSEHPGNLYECVAAAGASAPPPAPPPAAPGYSWRYTRVDDCTGNDTGSTPGAQPAPERCGAATLGMAAVCWDGAQQRHHNFSHAACAYKRVPQGACRSGANPGFLYECVSGSGSGAQPPPAPPPAPANPPPSPASLRYDWKTVGFGNCDGNDVGQTAGGAPLPAACDASSAGKAAVCWSTTCVYKSLPPSACKGGANSGTMYECVASGASGPAAPPTAASLVWNYVGVNDCNGNDTGSSAGSSPDPGRCGPGTAGLTAVCWDGVQQKRNGSGTPACSYKKVRPGDCRDGKSPGYVYRCGP